MKELAMIICAVAILVIAFYLIEKHLEDE